MTDPSASLALWVLVFRGGLLLAEVCSRWRTMVLPMEFAPFDGGVKYTQTSTWENDAGARYPLGILASKCCWSEIALGHTCQQNAGARQPLGILASNWC